MVFSEKLGPWKDAIQMFVFVIIIPFVLTAYLGTRNPDTHLLSRDSVIWIGRFYLIVTAILIPLTADHDFLYISIIGAVVLLISFYFGSEKELQVLVVNGLGILIVGFIALAGIISLLEH